MKKRIAKALLRLLNCRWLNGSPCKYGFIGNVDAFSYENLKSELVQRPDLTVRTLLEQADRFRACLRACREDGGLVVLEPDGTHHDATVWDLHDLRQSLTPPKDK
jgi:hypothetical protein